VEKGAISLFDSRNRRWSVSAGLVSAARGRGDLTDADGFRGGLLFDMVFR